MSPKQAPQGVSKVDTEADEQAPISGCGIDEVEVACRAAN